jgi:hypothetical protein
MIYPAERAAVIAQQRREEFPTPDQIAQQHAEGGAAADATRPSRRQANGRSVGGRYNKHDTARLRFIKDVSLRGPQFGKLVPEDDLRMLRLAPQNELVGPG